MYFFTFVTFNKILSILIFFFFFTKLSEIDPCEKRIDMLVGHAWRHIIMACSKLGAMATYVVKQACGNEIMPSV